MGLRDALYLLESKGYQVRFTGYGYVKSQSLKQAVNNETNHLIELTLGI
jgi:hypothetical protein